MAQQDILTAAMNILSRTDAAQADMIGYLAQGMTRIQREARLWFMEKQLPLASSTFLSTNQSTSLLQIIDVTCTDPSGIERPLTRLPYRRVNEIPAADWPWAYGRFGPNIVIRGSVPSTATATLYYYSAFTPFATLTSENELSLNAPDLAIYAALTFAGDRYRMDQLAGWEARYQQIKASCIQQTEDLDAEGGPAAIEHIYRWDH